MNVLLVDVHVNAAPRPSHYYLHVQLQTGTCTLLNMPDDDRTTNGKRKAKNGQKPKTGATLKKSKEELVTGEAEVSISQNPQQRRSVRKGAGQCKADEIYARMEVESDSE